ncbi:cytochrome c oxidase subunit II [bacterium]|mgnify:CR=1 FL=1|jgi:cytochrome c oxidase subunit II|nr:cytochrome c oxidase subunit II [bacterium]
MNQKTESLVDKGGIWFSEPISTFAAQVDSLFYFILVISIILFFAIGFVMFWFMIKYKRSETRPEASGQLTHNNLLEISWTVIPTILCLFVFYWGYKDFLTMSIPPVDAMEIRVTGQKWFWEFETANNGLKTTGEFAVPVNTPVKLVMTSKDVIHSLFVPNFRIKRDVVPNRYTRLWFEAEKTGSYKLFCAEYCGDAHSKMLATVHVLSEEDYDIWVDENLSSDSIPLEVVGKKVFDLKCSVCHSVDGAKKIGPTWKGLFGSNRTFEDGTSLVADEDYIKESINDPGAKIVSGYKEIPMSSFLGSVSDREIEGLIEYIKTLK